jgi:phosphatidylglycerophosphate synthase
MSDEQVRRGLTYDHENFISRELQVLVGEIRSPRPVATDIEEVPSARAAKARGSKRSAVAGAPALPGTSSGHEVLGSVVDHVSPFSLTTWGNLHTAAIVVATGLAVGLGYPPLIAWVAVASFLILLVQSWGSWTPTGQLGIANLVTTLRLVLTCALLVGSTRLPDAILVVTALSILILDGIDGWLARRFGAASEFGARYDVEADALFVIALAVILLSRGAAGPWVLIAGLWRYFYILIRLVLPSPIEAPRTLFGRVSYVVMLVSFILAVIVPPAWSARLALLGTLGVSVSFVRSFWQCYFPSRAKLGSQ